MNHPPRTDLLDVRPPGQGTDSRTLTLRELLEEPEGRDWIRWAARRYWLWPEWFQDALDTAEDELVRRTLDEYHAFWRRAA